VTIPEIVAVGATGWDVGIVIDVLVGISIEVSVGMGSEVLVGILDFITVVDTGACVD